jgi:hypothetical protein
MYAHQVMEDCKKIAKITKDDDCRKFCQVMPEFIRKAQKFHSLDLSTYRDIAKNLLGTPAFTGEAADIRLPYPVTWIDYTATGGVIKDGKTLCPKRAGLLISRGEYRFVLFLFAYSSEDSIWLFFPYKIQIDLSNKPGQNTWVVPILGGAHWSREDTVARFLSDYQDDVGAINITLLLLSCKNITTGKIHPDDKLQKARKKRGKLPLFSYHTLVIKPTGKRQESTPKHLWDNRIHLCRGHFKTYTEDNPLFGRIVGRFWWQPSARGRNRDGIVMKDYKIDGV